MAIQFPANPQLNATFDYDDKTYIWDGEKWTASAIGSFDEAYVNISGDTMTGDLTVPSLNGGPLAGFRNQIINGNFVCNQRGDVGTTGLTGEYGLDRWFVQGLTTWSRVAFPNAPKEVNVGMRLQSSEATIYARQMVELPLPGLPGQFTMGSQWTLSYWSNLAPNANHLVNCGFADNNAFLANAVDLSGGNVQPVDTGETNGSWRKYRATFTIGALPNATNIGLYVGIVTTNSFSTDWSIAQIQLEPGPVATVFEMRPIGTELALCQRYFFKHDRRIVAYAYTNREFRLFEYQFPTTMRRVPDLTFPINFNWKVGTLSRTATVDGFEVEGWADDEGQTTYIEGLTADAEL